MSRRVVDLDAARAARAEGRGDAPVVRFGGRDWQLPLEMPWEVAEVAAGGDAAAALRAVEMLLGSQWPEFKTYAPSVADMTVLLEAVASIYSADPGK